MTPPFRLEPGAVAIRYPPATFYPCPAHPRADGVVVRVVEPGEQGVIEPWRPTVDVRLDPPVCAECGRDLLSWAPSLA